MASLLISLVLFLIRNKILDNKLVKADEKYVEACKVVAEVTEILANVNTIKELTIDVAKQNEEAKIDGTENGQERESDETGLAQ